MSRFVDGEKRKHAEDTQEKGPFLAGSVGCECGGCLVKEVSEEDVGPGLKEKRNPALKWVSFPGWHYGISNRPQ